MAAIVISLIAVLVIALISALFCHWFIPKRHPATVAAVVYTVLIFQGLAWFETGAVDPNWVVSSLIVALIAWPVSRVVGRMFAKRRATPADKNGGLR